jgi:hypothetical protein
MFWQNYENPFWILALRGCWGQYILLFWKLFDETQISRPQEYTDTYPQAKSNLHISFCQRHFKRNISMWNTLYFSIIHSLQIILRFFIQVRNREEKSNILWDVPRPKKARMQEMATNKKWGKTFSILVRCTYLPLFAIFSL